MFSKFIFVLGEARAGTRQLMDRLKLATYNNGRTGMCALCTTSFPFPKVSIFLFIFHSSQIGTVCLYFSEGTSQ